MQDYRNLKVWQRSHQLTLEVYQMTGRFPADERFGLTRQMLLARDLNFMDSSAYQKLADELAEIRRMLYTFNQTLRAKNQ